MFANISSQASASLYSTHPPPMQNGPTRDDSNVKLKANVEGLGLRWEAAERRGGCCLVPLNSAMRDTGQELTKGGSVSQ